MKTVPYTYLVVFTHPETKEKKFYYGSKCAKGCHPTTFWVDYFTSSNIIKELREQHGDSCFSFEIRRTFKDRKSCQKWEERVLRKMKVASKPEWLNQNETHAPPIMIGEKHPLFGKKQPEEFRKKVSESRKKQFEDYAFLEKHRERMKLLDRSYSQTPEYRKQCSERNKKQVAEGRRVMPRSDGAFNGMYGRTHSDSARKIMSQKKQGIFDGAKNPMYGKTHSDAARKKIAEQRKMLTWITHPQTLQMKTVLKSDLFLYTSAGWFAGKLTNDGKLPKRYFESLKEKTLTSE